MATDVRLLPALMVMSFAALTFKAIDIAEAATAPAADSEETHDSEGEGSDVNMDEYFAGYEEFAEGDDAGAETHEEAQECVAQIDFTTETGLSQYEIQVLRTLSERREELEAREEEIDTREQVAKAAEARLDEQIAELKSLEAGVQDLLAAMEAKRDERLEALVKVYETMKPKDAARIFNTLEDEILLKVSQRMKSASLAAVMSAMSAERAMELTGMLASRAELPGSAEEVMNRANAG